MGSRFSFPNDFFQVQLRPLGLISAGAAVVCGATVLGFFGRYAWFLDLFTHFRLQYLGILVGCALLFALLKKRRAAGVYLGFAALNLVILPQMLWKPAAVEQIAGSGSGGASATRVLAFNIHSQADNAQAVREVIAQTDPDLILLQEITPQWVGKLHWLRQEYPYHKLAPRRDNFGIGFFSREPLDTLEIISVGDAPVPTVRVVTEIDGQPVMLIAAHLLSPVDARQSAMRNAQLEALPELLPTTRAIVVGDFNVTPWNYHFRRLLQRTNLVDSSRGKGFPATWPTYLPVMLIPIDHFLHTPDITVLRREVLPGAGSDHLPLLVDFSVTSS